MRNLFSNEGNKAMKSDIYQRVTDQIVASLEAGIRPWLQKPWSGEHAAGRITRPLRGNGIPYQGINILMLWGAAMEKGYSAPIWLTFKQALALGGAVRKGERGSLVVYASTFSRTDPSPGAACPPKPLRRGMAKGEANTATGEESERDIPFLKGYTVFNAEQIDGLPARFLAPAAPRLDPIQRIEHAERFFAATGATVRHGGNQAFYAPVLDYVQMPHFEAFRDAESYYAILAHELTHWTRHPSRLAREFGQKRFKDAGYAMEELVAELGAAFLSADLDLTPEPRPDHAAYIAEYLTVLKNDRRAIFTAASYAQRAADFLSGKTETTPAAMQEEAA
jgi:antirestriction protein ArdC